MPDSKLNIDADQQRSAVNPTTPQHDRWRMERITLEGERRITLIGVADGDGGEEAGEVASAAIEAGFREARPGSSETLERLLQRVLRKMNDVVYGHGPGIVVGVTLAAVEGNQMCLAQGGSQTRCYHVRGEGPAVLLTEDNHFPLGPDSSPGVLRISTHKLRRGDKLVFCTDGLFGAELVTASEIAKIDRYRELLGAARHLTGLAMGRNVRDNVTVVVAGYGRKRSYPIRSIVSGALSVLAASLILIVLAAFLESRSTSPEPRPPDIGIAVVAGGRTLRFEDLQVILPGRTVYVPPESAVHIKLKSRESPTSSLTQMIPNVDLYLGPGSQINLTGIDIEGYTEPQARTTETFDLTEIGVYRGRVLIFSRETRLFYMWLGEPSRKLTPLVRVEGSQAALGVERERERATLYCLAGACSIRLGKERSEIPPETKLSIALPSVSSRAITARPVDTDDWRMWYSLCNEGQGELLKEPRACEGLIPEN